MKKRVAIIGAGPAGLMAAEVLSQSDYEVHVYEQKPSAARKFLMAGKTGLNMLNLWRNLLGAMIKRNGLNRG